MNVKDIYRIANRCACYGDRIFAPKLIIMEKYYTVTCNNTVICCDMHVIALEMILRGEY